MNQFFCCCSVTKSCPNLGLQSTHGMQHARLFCLPLSPRVCSNSCPLSQWCYLTISSSVALFSFGLQSFPALGSFPVSQLFTSGGQSIGASASATVLPMSIQGWFPLGLTGLISLQSKGLSRVFSGTTIQRHQFFGIQPSFWSKSYICWRRKWQPTPVLLPGKSHGWRSLVGYSPWRRVGHDWTTSLSLSCSGEGNGHPLQYSCPENPRDRGAWWAAVYGVAQSRTRLKWLSSSSSLHLYMTTGKTRIFDYMDFYQQSNVSAF